MSRVISHRSGLVRRHGIVVPGSKLSFSTWKLTTPVNTSGTFTGASPKEVLPSALASYVHPSYFVGRSTGVLFAVPCQGVPNSAGGFPRSELREMVNDTTLAAWGVGDGKTHSMPVTTTIWRLPKHRPQVVFGQVHGDDVADSVSLLVADGYRPTTGTQAVTDEDRVPFTLMHKLNLNGSQDSYRPILTGYVLGAKATCRYEIDSTGLKVYADYGTTAVTLRDTIPASKLPADGLYFKAGAYVQSNPTNTNLTVPSNTCENLTSLTVPPAGSSVGGAASDEFAEVEIHAISISHVTDDNGTPETPATVPFEVPAMNAVMRLSKITLPVNSAGNLGAGSGDGKEILRPQLDGYQLDPWFKVDTSTGEQAILFRAPVNGATTKNSGYPRSELREMTGSNGTAEAAWNASSGTHIMTITQAVTELPLKKPQVTMGQIHDADDDWMGILADGFKPTNGRIATTGRSTIPFTITWRYHGSDSATQKLLTGYVLGAKATYRAEVRNATLYMYADYGTTAVTLRDSKPLTSTDNFFKIGCYTQSNPVNKNSDGSSKTVPSGTCEGGQNLQTPLAGAATGGDVYPAAGEVLVFAGSYSHA